MRRKKDKKKKQKTHDYWQMLRVAMKGSRRAVVSNALV